MHCRAAMRRVVEDPTSGQCRYCWLSLMANHRTTDHLHNAQVWLGAAALVYTNNKQGHLINLTMNNPQSMLTCTMRPSGPGLQSVLHAETSTIHICDATFCLQVRSFLVTFCKTKSDRWNMTRHAAVIRYSAGHNIARRQIQSCFTKRQQPCSADECVVTCPVQHQHPCHRPHHCTCLKYRQQTADSAQEYMPSPLRVI